MRHGQLKVEKGKGAEPVRLWQDAEPWGPYLLNAIKAKYLVKRDHDYIVNEQQEVKIINTVTGRVMPISRWQDNLHQVGIYTSAGMCVQCDNCIAQWMSHRVC